MLVVGGMFSMFFFLTQYLQGVLGYGPLQAGLAFLPMTLVMFSMVRIVPRLVPRVGGTRVLIGGLVLAVTGMAWLSRLTVDTAFFPGIALPLVLLGTGMGLALAPLTAAGIAGVAERDAGAGSGLVNVAQQLGAALGVGILVTVFAAAERGAAAHPSPGLSARAESARELAHAVGSAVTGSAVFAALGLTVVVAVMRGPAPAVAFARLRNRLAVSRSAG
jgi:predicted MFS family arabinose efflux permease